VWAIEFVRDLLRSRLFRRRRKRRPDREAQMHELDVIRQAQVLEHGVHALSIEQDRVSGPSLSKFNTLHVDGNDHHRPPLEKDGATITLAAIRAHEHTRELQDLVVGTRRKKRGIAASFVCRLPLVEVEAHDRVSGASEVPKRILNREGSQRTQLEGELAAARQSKQ